jgi:predicted flap endonuclease-1-like 5' DNA nuclease
LLGLLVVAASVGWLLLRRRGPAVLAPALAPAAPPSPATAPAAPATVPAAAAQPEETDVLATDAGLAVELAAAAPEPVTPPAPDQLATDAGLTPTGADDSPAGAAPLTDPISGEETVVLPRVVDADAPAPAGTDDLRKIRGIGPAIERTLHELGITTYQQVADLHGEQLAAVRRRLEAFSARIEREDWAGQARELRRRKYGD